MLTLGPEMTAEEIAAEAALGEEEGDDDDEGLFMLPPPHPSLLLGEDTEIGLNYEGMQPRHGPPQQGQQQGHAGGGMSMGGGGQGGGAHAPYQQQQAAQLQAHPPLQQGLHQLNHHFTHHQQHHQAAAAGAPAPQQGPQALLAAPLPVAATGHPPAPANVAAVAGPAGLPQQPPQPQPPRRADPLQHHFYSHYYNYQTRLVTGARRRRHVLCTLIDLGACLPACLFARSVDW